MPSGILLNPRLPVATRESLLRAWEKHTDEIERVAPGAIGVLTSGSTSSQAHEIVVILLSERAQLTSAASVNQHLGITAEHVWGLMIPTFHVGGYMISVRAKLSGSRVATFEDDWEPLAAKAFLEREKVTHLSLVPTQVFDFVNAGICAPSSLQAVIVGGGRLDAKIKMRGRELKWPLLESYGLTEFCSQVATEVSSEVSLDVFRETPSSKQALQADGWMKVLPHAEVQTEEDDDSYGSRLVLRGEALMSGQLRVKVDTGESQVVARDPQQKFWLTQDRVQLRRGTDGVWLKFVGRVVDVVKVLGENVDLARIRQFVAGDFAAQGLTRRWEVVALPDPRSEHEIVLVLEAPFPSDCHEAFLSDLRERMKHLTLPVERPTRVLTVAEIPKSALGKTLFAELRDILTRPSKN